jgi:hypothetical protein
MFIFSSLNLLAEIWYFNKIWIYVSIFAGPVLLFHVDLLVLLTYTHYEARFYQVFREFNTTFPD